MNVNQLKLIHFRNYENTSFSFDSNCIHYLYGKNAQGKTNLIEAIYFLSHLHSFRTNQLSSLVMKENESLIIEAKVESNKQNEHLKVVVSHHKKHLFRFLNPVNKYSDFVGIVNAILFCPDDMMIFSQSPKFRRRFIDMELIKLSKTYTTTLSHYQKILKERNLALKQNEINDALIDIYTDQMIQDEKIILNQRNHFIEQLILKAKQIYPFFSSEKEIIDAKYETFVSIDDDLEENLIHAYQKSLAKDKLYHQTNLGIHKDDIQILLNGSNINDVASQGQKRSFLLALKLGLAQIIYEKSHQYPILLLDDVFSELDDIRKKQLIQKLPLNMQIFITTTEWMDPSSFGSRPVKFYKIEKGSIKEVDHGR